MEGDEIADGVVAVVRMQETSIRVGREIFRDTRGVRVRWTDEDSRSANLIGNPGELIPKIVCQRRAFDPALVRFDQKRVQVVVIIGPELISPPDFTQVGLAKQFFGAAGKPALVSGQGKSQDRNETQGENHAEEFKPCESTTEPSAITMIPPRLEQLLHDSAGAYKNSSYYGNMQTCLAGASRPLTLMHAKVSRAADLLGIDRSNGL